MSKFIIQLFLMIIFFKKNLFENCSNGCLRCLPDQGDTNICQICDIENFYVRYGYRCKKITIENCQKTIDGINCALCNVGYYLDQDTQKCIKVDKEIENCEEMQDKENCKKCKKPFFFDKESKTCVSATKDISNCLYYQTTNTCQLCNKSKLNTEATACSLMQNTERCDYFSQDLACTQCKSGYKIFNNKYLQEIKTDSLKFKAFYTQVLTNKITDNNFYPRSTNICIQKIENCEDEDESKGICNKCNDGYFLQDNYCFKNPISQIKNCLFYTEASVKLFGFEGPAIVKCSECMEKYYLNSNICKAHQLIANCIEYHKTTANECIKCTNGYYLSQNDQNEQICQKRSIFTSNCLEYENDSEKKCQQCVLGYEITNLKKCLPKILNCEEHLTIVNELKQTEQLICKKCNQGLYIKTTINGDIINTTCEFPAVLLAGCVRYQSETQCIECRQGFYLANFLCHEMDNALLQQLSCERYSIINKNDCELCPAGKFLFRLFNICEKMSTDTGESVQNCQRFEKTNNVITCLQCKEMSYYDSTDKKCKTVQIDDCKAIAIDKPSCTKCDLNKSLIPNNNLTNNKCVKVPDVLLRNCSDFKFLLTGNQDISCDICTGQNYPRQFDNINYSFCVYETQLIDFRVGLSDANLLNLDNCTAFRFVGKDKECVYCDQQNDKRFIQNNFCKTMCESDEVAYSFFIEETKYQPYAFMKCKRQNLIAINQEFSLENCKILDYNIALIIPTAKSEDQIPKGCTICNDGYKGYYNSSIQAYWAHLVYRPASHLQNSAIQKSNFFSIWHKKVIYNTCEQFNKDFETQTTNKLTTFTQTAEIKFPKFKDGFAYTKIASLNEAAGYQDYFNNVESVKKFVYSEDQSNYLGISSCKLGQTGVIVKSDQSYHSTNQDDNIFVINKCEDMPACDKNVFYTGICNHDIKCRLDLYLSCSKCSDPVKIITVPSKLQTWTIPSENQFDGVSQNEGNEADYLLKGPFKSIPNMISDQNKANLITSCEIPGFYANNIVFPKFCAVQVVLDIFLFYYPQNDSQKTPNPACIACFPKYKPTLSNSNAKSVDYKYVVSCEEIKNCKTSIEYNKCQECEPGFVLKYEADANNEWLTNAEECVQNTIEGCHVGLSQGLCYKCQKGYYLNEVNNCDKVLDNNVCLSMGTLKKNEDNAYKYLNDDPFKLGCIKCKNTMYAVSFEFKPKICIQSKTSMDTNNFFTISNCKQYKYNQEKIYCDECESEYFKTKDERLCVKETLINCLIYEKLPDNTMVCSQCKEKYFFKNNQCHQGNIQGCLLYENQENCVKCDVGYYPIRVFNNLYTLCFDLSKSVTGCNQFDPNEVSNGVLKCTQCDNTSYIVNFNLSVKTCTVFPTIEYCVKYNIQNDLESSNFFCQECLPEYYAQNKVFPSTCIKRTRFPIFECQQYQLDDDLCQKCVDNFFLSKDKKLCKQNPKGIEKCRVYQSFSVCLECEAPYHIENSICKKIPDDEVIENCYSFNEDKTCKQCDKGYEYSNSLCSKHLILNCQTPGFNKVCDKCDDNYAFFSPSCEKVNISNCQVFLNPNTCSQCESNFKLLQGRCLEATVIENCLEYNPQNQCTKCKEGMINVNNGESCQNLNAEEESKYKDQYCYQYERLNTCYICSEETIFDSSGSCQSHGKSGCAYSDPYDDSICLLCKAGMYMDTQNNCNANKAENNNTQVDVVKKSQFYSEKFMKIIGLMNVIYILFVLQII